ncbi:MAG: RimK family alpha-L-glutamate ligase [Candidatus Sigynarchaeota archaeon]
MDDILLLSRDTLREERDELLKRGVAVAYRTWAEVTAPPVDPPAVARWMLFVQDMTFQLSYMEELERSGTRVINTSRSVQMCDKASIYFLWNRHLKERIDMPPTIMTADVKRAREFVTTHGQAVLKPIDGQGGEGTYILDARDVHGFSKLNDHPGTMFLQAMIPSTHEIRTVVAGEEVIAQYARYNPGGLHSLGAGATLLPVDDGRIDLPPDIARDLGELALATRKLTGLDLLALDTLIDARQQPWLLEWNPFFAYGQTKGLGFNIAYRIACFILSTRSR